MCNPPLLWRDTQEKGHKRACCPCPESNADNPYLLITCSNKIHCNKQFKIKIRSEKIPVLFEDTDKMLARDSYLCTVRMIPLALLKNLLPFPIEFSYSPLNEQKRLEPGEEFNLPFIDFGHSGLFPIIVIY